MNTSVATASTKNPRSLAHLDPPGELVVPTPAIACGKTLVSFWT